MYSTTLVLAILYIPTAYAAICNFPTWLQQAPHVIKTPAAFGSGGWNLNGHLCSSDYNEGWCTYACAPGYEAIQWQPDSCYFCDGTDGKPTRTHGGLQCTPEGTLTVPIPSKPFCAQGWKGLRFQNRLTHPASTGYTVVPGFENIGYTTLIQPNQTVPGYIASKEGWNGGGGPSYYISPFASSTLQLYQKNASYPVGLYSPWGLSVTYDYNSGKLFTTLGYQPEFTFTTNPPLWENFMKNSHYRIDMQCKTLTGQKCSSWDDYWCDATRCVCNGGTCYGCNNILEPSGVPTCHAVVVSNSTIITVVIRSK